MASRRFSIVNRPRVSYGNVTSVSAHANRLNPADGAEVHKSDAFAHLVSIPVPSKQVEAHTALVPRLCCTKGRLWDAVPTMGTVRSADRYRFPVHIVRILGLVMSARAQWTWRPERNSGALH